MVGKGHGASFLKIGQATDFLASRAQDCHFD
jgi:hypothetical protein